MIDRAASLTLTAGGISAATLRRLAGARRAYAPDTVQLGIAARHARGARRLSLLGRQESTAISATSRRRWSQAHRTQQPQSSSSTRTRPTWASRRPGVFSLGLTQGMKLVSAFQMGGARRVRLRLPEGRGTGRHQGPRRQDHRARQRRLAVDLRSDAEGGRRRIKKVKYVEAGWPTWGTALKAARATRRCRGRAARPVEGSGPRF